MAKTNNIKEVLKLANDNLKEQNFTEAQKNFEKARDLDSKSWTIQNNLGIIYKKLGQYQNAIDIFQKIIDNNPKIPEPHNNLANIFKEIGLIKESEKYYFKALKLKPNSVEYFFNLAVFYSDTGNIQKAAIYYKKILSIQPNNLHIYYQLSKIKKDTLDDELNRKILSLEKKNIPKQNLAYLYFIKSKYSHNKKKYKQEFDNLIKAHDYLLQSSNQQYKDDINYWLIELPKFVDKFNDCKITSFQKDFKPIFIFGVPRSGTTLVESIISASNKSIKIGEETSIIHFFTKQLIVKNKNINNLENFVTKIISNYTEKFLIDKNRNYIFTDKSLENFFYLILIKKIFPKAKFINCKRNVKNSIISILKNNLISPWAHQLENIFQYFDIYFNIINKYKKSLPNSIYDIELEKLTEFPERESKSLLKFCELDWSPESLQFYNRTNIISKTSSQTQIRNPIYKKNVNDFLNYQEFLKPFGKKYYWFN